MSGRRSRNRKSKSDAPKIKDLWVKLLEARVKAKKEREEKIDKDLDDLLSGKSAEEQKTVADGEESKASESTKAEGEGTTPNEETSEEKKDGTDKKTEAQAEGGETAKAPAQPQFALETNADKCKENILLVVGAKDSGKTTQIQAFLNPAGKDGKHKSTTALEYTYGRKSNGNIKDVAHIWELGGGLRLRSMLPVVIKPANIDRLTVVIVIDLSQTGDAVPLLEKWLGVLRQHTSNALSAMKKDKKLARLASRVKKRSQVPWISSPDKDNIDISPIPIVVLCTKLDVLMDKISAIKRKSVLNAIRFLCLSHGASCLTTDHKTKAQLNQVRNILNHHGFGAELKKSQHLDSAKSIVVPAGADSFAAIGIPNGVESSVYDQTRSTEGKLTMWRQAIELHFDPTGAEKDTNVIKDDVEAAEPVVDDMVERKREQLVQYRKEVERREKLALAEAKKGRR